MTFVDDAGHRKTKLFSEEKTAEITSQMLSALCYMHSKGLVHRDVKPGNFAYQGNGTGENCHKKTLKLLDFELGTYYKEGEPITAAVGTHPYMAPEFFERECHGAACDLWSLGVIVFRLLTGRFPFTSKSDCHDKDEKKKAIHKAVLEGNFVDQAPAAWAKLSTTAQEFIKQLFVIDPKQRLTAQQALAHSWLAEKHPCTSHDPVLGALQFVDALCKASQWPALKKVFFQIMTWSTLSEERWQAAEFFRAVDKNCDGVCTAEEVLSVLAEAGGISPEETLVAMNRLSALHEQSSHIEAKSTMGEIYYVDIVSAFIIEGKIPVNDRMLQYTFCQLSEKLLGGRYITEDSLLAMLGTHDIGQPLGDALDQVIDEVKGMHPGRVSLDEFSSYIRGERLESLTSFPSRDSLAKLASSHHSLLESSGYLVVQDDPELTV